MFYCMFYFTCDLSFSYRDINNYIYIIISRIYTRTRRYCSFINYALNNYQDKITNP